jgi:hypothetical protein
MAEDQRNARIFGVLFDHHVPHVDSGVGSLPTRSRRPGWLHRRRKDNQIYLGAFLELLLINGPGFMVPFGNGLILGYLMYSSGLVPRRMAWLGLIGGPLLLFSSIGTLFDWWGAGTTVPALLVIPEFLWELSLGVYAAVWGFRRDAPILSAERRSAVP